MITVRLDGIGTALGTTDLISQLVGRTLPTVIANHAATTADPAQPLAPTGPRAAALVIEVGPLPANAIDVTASA